MFWDQATDNFVLLQDNVIGTTYTVTGLDYGVTYKFKIDSRTEWGRSVESNVVTILASQVPDASTTPTTAVNGDYIDVTWSTPFDHGSPLMYYKIGFLGGDLATYYLELVDCDGQEATIFANTKCTVAIQTLLGAPYYIEWGSSIVV